MRTAAAVLVSTLALALAEGDPAGTEAVEVEVGKGVEVTAPDGSTVICDDPSVVGPELLGDGRPGFLLRGLSPGSTLCGIRKPEQVSGGIYRITVKPASKKKEPPPRIRDGGSEDAGTADGGTPDAAG